ncbi:hypothetical protein RhiXN_11527 [Rhizoctonia solani]|uniref:Uncharacterized protein n=1 Tax=Rhizoctonia solani TaxID=456999 RepID=A0A8H8P518_9AGAM|nr:uncharacterized protein RhiXN_11527 [Rhizoctonia solani]QRW24615.1 hypothetical protein RhiXN_11527 [Rhizoctonia solani]
MSLSYPYIPFSAPFLALSLSSSSEPASTGSITVLSNLNLLFTPPLPLLSLSPSESGTSPPSRSLHVFRRLLTRPPSPSDNPPWRLA